MATLSGTLPANTYKQLLQVGSGNVGLSASIQYVQDGSGTSSVLGLSTTAVQINAASITINGVALTLGGAFTTSGAFAVTQTYTGITNVTFPTSGTLYSTANFPIPLPLASGGTNAALTANTGGIVYSGASALAILAGTATAGKVLQSGATAAPSWSTPTYPSASGTAGKVLISDGTNNVYSTPTFPNASATAGKFIRSDGTNWAAASSTIPDTFAQGDLIYGSAANTLTALAKDTNATRYLSNTGTSNNPAWAQVNLANGVTGVLPLANGGSGYANSQQLVQRVVTTITGQTGTSTIPYDNTIPQNTEGTEVATVSITPKNASNILRITLSGHLGNSATNSIIVALFQDSTANALCAQVISTGNLSDMTYCFPYQMTAGTTSATTFKIRIGDISTGSWVIGSTGGAVNLGGVMATYLTVEEYTP